MKLVLSALAALSAAPLYPVFAQSYPSKPIELVVHTSAGGGSDLVARLIAPKLSEEFAQQFVIDNHAGAGGI